MDGRRDRPGPLTMRGAHTSLRVVILNGASSAGKTTLATAFRDQRAAVGDYWFLIGIDDFLARLPSEWMSAGPDRGAFAADGVRFEDTSDGPTVRVGSLGRQLLRACQATVRAVARAGLNVIVDEVVIDETSWHDWVTALEGLDVTWIGIRCNADVAEERNKLRGDRFAGLARAQSVTVHQHAAYNFEIDTTTASPTEALSQLKRQLGY